MNSVSKCSGCGASIVWLRTSTGKSMPVEARSVSLHDKEFDHQRHKSHFATCPKARQFRSKR